eukprot:10137016-Ditylum_brightwellii.AAC.1
MDLLDTALNQDLQNVQPSLIPTIAPTTAPTIEPTKAGSSGGSNNNGLVRGVIGGVASGLVVLAIACMAYTPKPQLEAAVPEKSDAPVPTNK